MNIYYFEDFPLWRYYIRMLVRSTILRSTILIFFLLCTPQEKQKYGTDYARDPLWNMHGNQNFITMDRGSTSYHPPLENIAANGRSWLSRRCYIFLPFALSNIELACDKHFLSTFSIVIYPSLDGAVVRTQASYSRSLWFESRNFPFFFTFFPIIFLTSDRRTFQNILRLCSFH